MTASATIPTDQELATLPRWAVIAYAARGARRALPAIGARWPDIDPAQQATLEDTVALVERACAAPGTVGFEQLHTAGMATMDVAMAAARAAHAGVEAGKQTEPGPRLLAAMQLARAVSTAASAGKAAAAGDDHMAPGFAADSAGCVDVALESPAFAAAARQDFEALRDAAKANAWSAETGVDPATLGAEWPGGTPEGWPG